MTNTRNLPSILKVEDIALGANMPITVKSIDVDGVELSTSIGSRFEGNDDTPLLVCDTTIDIMVDLKLAFAAGFNIDCAIAYSSMPIGHSNKSGVNFADVIELIEGGIFKFESLNDHLADNIHENLVILSGDAHALKCMAQLKIGSFEKSFGSGDTCVVLEEKHAFTVVSLLDNLLNGTGTHTNTLFTKELRESISAQVRQKAIQFLNQDLAV